MEDSGVEELSSLLSKASQSALTSLGKVNILIAGSAGVGKSTLVNAVFGKRLAGTGVGTSQTKGIEAHEVPGSPLRIYDTRGFEIRDSEITVGAVRSFIEELRGSTDPTKQIHMAWLCILEQSHRIESVHTTVLAELRELHVPTVVVITQALGEEEMERKVRELAIPNDGVVSVLAEPKSLAGHVFPQKGVKELVELSLRLLPEAQKAAFTAVQIADFEMKRKAVVATINKHSVLAGGSALIPVPGGHSVALIGIQIKLVASINAAVGLSLTDSDAVNLAKTLSGILALKAGGQAAFVMSLSEAMKFFPGIGWFGAAAIGGPIGAAATKALGHVYFDSITEYVKRQEPLPSPEVLKLQMEATYNKQQSYYEKVAAEPAHPHVS